MKEVNISGNLIFVRFALSNLPWYSGYLQVVLNQTSVLPKILFRLNLALDQYPEMVQTRLLQFSSTIKKKKL